RRLRQGAAPSALRRIAVPVRLGINPIGWSNDDLPELGGATPPEACLSAARAAGSTRIQLGRKLPRGAGEPPPLRAPHRVSPVSGWYGGRLRERPPRDEIVGAMQAHLDLLAALGCDVLVFAEVSDSVHARREVPRSRRPTLGADEWPRFGERLTDLAEHSLRR